MATKTQDIEVFIDNEEDEIFFGTISEKEADVRAKLQSRKTMVFRNRTDEVHVNKSAENRLPAVEEPELDVSSSSSSSVVMTDEEKLEKNQIEESLLEEEGSNPNWDLEGLTKDLEKKIDLDGQIPVKLTEALVSNDEEEEVIIINENCEANSPLLPSQTEIHKEHAYVRVNKSNMNLDHSIDHNYSTPVKNKIDRSILTTPKTVVKADQDGGFLTVLSEIALVKAEHDEEAFRDGDENKENKNVTPKKLQVPDIQITEATPSKAVATPSPVKLQTQIKRFQLVYNSPEAANTAGIITPPPEEPQPRVVVLNNEKPIIITDVKPLSEVKNHIKLTDSPLSSKILQNVDALSHQAQNETTESLTCQSPSSSCTYTKKTNDLFKNIQSQKRADDSILEENLSNHESGICFNETIEEFIREEEEKDMLKNFTITLTDEDVQIIENFLSPGKLESLSALDIKDAETVHLCKPVTKSEAEPMSDFDSKPEVMIQTQSNRAGHTVNGLSIVSNQENLNNATYDENEGHNHTQRSEITEEATKIVQNLQSDIIDDRLSLSLLEVDSDRSDLFSNINLSDTFDDSVIKPVTALSNEQADLLKAIVGNKSASKTPFQPLPVQDNIIEKEKRKPPFKTLLKTPLKSKTPAKIMSAGRVKTETASAKKTCEKIATLAKKTPLKVTSGGKIGSNSVDGMAKRIRIVNEKCAKTENKATVSRSVEKDFRAPVSSRIPKFGTSSSKIPAPKQTVKPPQSKAQKTLQFSKLESPVNAYINNKPPPLVQNVKGEVKKNSVLKVWMKGASESTKSIRMEVDSSQSTIPALPVVNYRSATPLKLEKPVESRLPRLAPTMKKLITANSPTVLRHEGRIHLGGPKRQEININESMAVDPSEMSVVVSHTAQRSNTIK